jgi:hypothetical protein
LFVAGATFVYPTRSKNGCRNEHGMGKGTGEHIGPSALRIMNSSAINNKKKT